MSPFFMKNIIIVMLCTLSILTSVYSDGPGDERNVEFWEVEYSQEGETSSNLSISVLGFIITNYNNHVSENTIHRCPFKTSCSNFFYKAVVIHGIFFGSIIFIDRYFYRENPQSFMFYNLVETKDRGLKLDDDFFLSIKARAD